MSRKTIDVLFHCGLSISYDSIAKLLCQLSRHCINLAKQITCSLHMFCYDNINISSLIFAEQRGAATPVKVQSGTFELRNASLDDLKLQPYYNAFRRALESQRTKGTAEEEIRLYYV
jgi:hypothetical protein